MPKPDKTKLRKWDFDSFKQHEVKGQSFSNLSELQKLLKIIDVENTKNLVVQHNNALAYTQVSDQAQKWRDN